MATINVRVRRLIRIASDDIPDARIQEHIEDAVPYVAKDTEQTFTVADYANATVSNNYFDGLIAYRAAWTIFVERFQSSVKTKDPNNNGQGIEIVYEQQYLVNLMMEYPLKVEYRGGGYRYARPSGDGSGSVNLPYPDTYLLDNRPKLGGLRGDRSISEI